MLLTPAYVLHGLISLKQDPAWTESLRRPLRSVFAAAEKALKFVDLTVRFKMPHNRAGYTMMDFEKLSPPPPHYNFELNSPSTITTERNKMYFDDHKGAKMQHLEVEESFLYFDLHDLKNNFIGHPRKVACSIKNSPEYTQPGSRPTTKQVKEIMNRYLGPAEQVTEKSLHQLRNADCDIMEMDKYFAKAERTESPLMFHHTATAHKPYVSAKLEVRKTADYSPKTRTETAFYHHAPTNFTSSDYSIPRTESPLYHHATTITRPFKGASFEIQKNTDISVRATKTETPLYHHAPMINKPFVLQRSVKKDVREIMNRYLKPEDQLDDDNDDDVSRHRNSAKFHTETGTTTMPEYKGLKRRRSSFDTWDNDDGDFGRNRKHRKSEISDIMNRYLDTKDQHHYEAWDNDIGYEDRIREPRKSDANDFSRNRKQRKSDISDIMNRYLDPKDQHQFDPWDNDIGYDDEIRKPKKSDPGIYDIMNHYLDPKDHRKKSTTKFGDRDSFSDYDPEVKKIMQRIKQHKFNQQKTHKFLIDPQVEEIMHRYLNTSDIPVNYARRIDNPDPVINSLMDKYLDMNKNGCLGRTRDFGLSRVHGLSALARRESVKGLMEKYLPDRLKDHRYYIERMEMSSEMPDLLKEPHYDNSSTYRLKNKSPLSERRSSLLSDRSSSREDLLNSYKQTQKHWIPERSPSILDDDNVFQYDLNSRVEKDKNRSGDPLWRIMSRYLNDVNLQQIGSSHAIKRMFSCSSADSGLGWMESEDGTTTGISR